MLEFEAVGKRSQSKNGAAPRVVDEEMGVMKTFSQSWFFGHFMESSTGGFSLSFPFLFWRRFRRVGVPFRMIREDSHLILGPTEGAVKMNLLEHLVGRTQIEIVHHMTLYCTTLTK